MDTKAGRNRALQSVGDACARLAVAAGATPGTAVNCVLSQGDPSRRKLQKQLEEPRRQAKRPKNTLIQRYNVSIDQLNAAMGTQHSHINPSARHCDMDETQRELCAQAALNCARLLSACARLMPDEVICLAEQRQQILLRIEQVDKTLLDSIDRLDEAQAALQALTARRYLENCAAMSWPSKRCARDKFVAVVDKGDRAIGEILAAVARHVSSCEALTRNSIQTALLLGADFNEIIQVAGNVMSVSYPRRHGSIPAGVALDRGPAIADVQRCVVALQSSRQCQTRAREHVAGWRENAETVRNTVDSKLTAAAK